LKPRQRVSAALAGAPLDRPPVSFWGHVYHRESSAPDLVDATLEAQRRYAWDWVKLNPRKHYHVEPWGVRYRYSGRPNEKPALEDWPVRDAEDWRRIHEQPHDRGALAEQLEAVRMLRASLDPDVPMIETVFTPLAVLGEMVETPDVLRRHLDENPAGVHAALESVTRTFEKFVRAVLAAGADGVYFATVDWASRDLLDAAAYRTWARPGDLRVIAAAAGARFNVLHVCKRHNLLFEVADYPVHAFSWDALEPSNPSLADALKRLPGAVMGGIPFDDTLKVATPDRFADAYRRGLEATQGRRWLVAPGCSIPPAAAPENLEAVRNAVTATRLDEIRT